MPQRLDNPSFVRKNDPKGMMDYALGFPEQCRKPLALSQAVSLPDSLRGKSNVVVCGVGGSAAGGDFLKGLFDAGARVPLVVCRNYDLPAFVDSNSLVIACSYSGNTEETITATKQALERGAAVFAVTSGGVIGELGLPTILIPGGQPPRTALGYLFIPLAQACASLGYIEEPDFESAFALLDKCADDWGVDTPNTKNPSKTLAAYLFGRLPVVYGLGSWQGMVASRWKGQINENAKVMCFAHAFPELNHNELMGWQRADLQNVAHWAVIILEGGDESVRMQTRARVTTDVFRGISECFTVTARGETLLEKMLSLTYFGDFVSLYLAALNDVDPETIDAINLLKKSLSEIIEPQARTVH